ncbi:hypothetical protein [Streptomyces sp. NPDC047070]|uniref:hypothetical protein n=1 Tax=Streptomyces sp. NPDC047070 TaxID=3154923 RepID=UPI00345739A1
MSTRRAAARLAELWPRLPGLAGPDWLAYRPGFVVAIEAMARADSDGERARQAQRLLASVSEHPHLKALLLPEFEDGPAGVDEPSWREVSLALHAVVDPGGWFEQAVCRAAQVLEAPADGLRLTDTLLAAGIVAALGCDPEALIDPEQWEETGRLGKRHSILGGSVARVVPWADPLPWLVEHPDEALSVADTWQLAVDDRRAIRVAPAVDDAEIAAVLSQGTGVLSVLHSARTAEVSRVPRWSWPLRLAVLPGTGSSVALRRELLAAAGARTKLLAPVPADGRWNRASLLLLPHAAGSAAPGSADGPHTTAAVTVCDSPELMPSAEELRSLAAHHRAAVAVAVHPGPSPRRWLEALLDELSLDLPLDVALYGAARECGTLMPVLVADTRLLDATRIRPVLAAAPPAALEPPEEARLGRALRGGPGPDNARLAPAVAEGLRAVARRSRRVPVRYLRANVVEPDGNVPAGGIAAHSVFHVRVLLAADARAHPAEPAFPADSLPPGRAHRLTVVATDLAPAAGRDRAVAQEIELPGEGDSSVAHLRFTAGAAGEDVRIWITVLYGARVLQTGLLSGRVGAQRTPVFRVESVVRAPTDELDLARPHDATLLVGRTTQGLPLVTTRTEQFIRRSASHDLRRTLDDLLGGLHRLVDGADTFGSYESPGFSELMIQLARRGRRLRKALFADGWESDGLVQQLRRAHAVSVFSTGPEEILPVEFLYDRELETTPGRILHLCPHAPEHVDSLDCEGCPQRDDLTAVCPFGFWGASKVIERHVRRTTVHEGFSLAISPDTERHAFDLAPVCAAASARADDNESRAWTTAVASLSESAAGTVRLATGWSGLHALLQELREGDTPPGAVLLFPHSTEKADGVVVLELGEGDEADIIDGLEFLVAGDGGPEPVVLLLGCATAVGPTPFSDASAALLDHGAPGVIATAVPVRGQHIVPVGVRLVAELQAAASEACGSALGEALLRARRKLLADGQACVLALVGFGDTDWQMRDARGTPDNTANGGRENQ